MASKLTIRGNWWYTYVCVWDKNSQSKKQIPIKLQPKEMKKEAYICLDEVERKEKYIKQGLEVEFSWLNDNIGVSKVVKLNIGNTIDQWLEVRKQVISLSHYNRNVISMDRFLDIVNQSRPIQSIGLRDIDKFKVHFSKKHTKSGININLRAIKTFLKWCVEMDYLSKMPILKLLDVGKPLPKYITENEFNQIMSLEDLDSHFKDAFYLYWSTGCRKCEVFNGKVKGMWLIVDSMHSKTKMERQIRLDKQQLSIVNDMQRRLSKHLQNGYKAKNYIDRYNKIFVKACKGIGIYDRGVSLHCLRHTFAVMRYLTTNDIYQVKMDLGHSSVTVTEVYANFNQERLKEDFPSLKSITDNMDKIRNDMISTMNPSTNNRVSRYHYRGALS